MDALEAKPTDTTKTRLQSEREEGRTVSQIFTRIHFFAFSSKRKVVEEEQVESAIDCLALKTS